MKTIFETLGSLKLTAACLLAALFLVFFGTLAQVDHGIFTVQKAYFQSFFVVWKPPGSAWGLPLPGGYLVGGILVINLIVAQVINFDCSWRRLGLHFMHGGLILLLIGQLFTDLTQEETHMRLVQDEPANYSESSMKNELVFMGATKEDRHSVIAIPETVLAKKSEIKHPSLPFTIKVKQYHVNSRLARPDAKTPGPLAASQGAGATLLMTPYPPATQTDERNLPAAVFELEADGQSLGTWLASAMLNESQPIPVKDQTWQMSMRPTRHYKPYTLTLLKFTHEKYKGTEIPKNFASRIRLNNTATGEQREALIYMNNPLRYGGETYYQGSYDPNDPRVSILQVVRNPSWLIPYISCVLVGIGMTFHFILHLVGFINKRRSP